MYAADLAPALLWICDFAYSVVLDLYKLCPDAYTSLCCILIMLVINGGTATTISLSLATTFLHSVQP